MRDPAHRADAVALLKEKFKLTDAVAERTYDLLVDPAFGFNVDARFDPEGFRNLLALRAEIRAGTGRRWRRRLTSTSAITTGRSSGSSATAVEPGLFIHRQPAALTGSAAAHMSRAAVGTRRVRVPTVRLTLLSKLKAGASSAEEEPMAKTKFRPLHDRVVVRRLAGEEKTKGGIIIPDTAKEKPQEGEVIAVGPGARDETGKLITLDVKAGDRVLFGKWSGTEVKLDGEELLIMKESDIMGVIA